MKSYSNDTVSHDDIREIATTTASTVQATLNEVDAAQQQQIDVLYKWVYALAAVSLIQTLLISIRFL